MRMQSRARHQMKLRHDFAGHYNRPIFSISNQSRRAKLYSVHGGGADAR